MISPVAKLFQLGVVAAALTLAAAPVTAGPIFAIELDFGSIETTSPTSLSDTFSFHSGFEGTNFYSHDAFAAAGPGELRTSAEAAIQLTPVVCLDLCLGLRSALSSTDATATFRLDDVIIGGAGSAVPGSLSLSLDGGLSAFAFAQLGTGVGAESSANAGIDVFISLAGHSFAGSQQMARLWQVDTMSGGGSADAIGLLTGFTGSGGIITPTVMLPVGTPFVLTVSLSSSASTRTSNAIIGSRRQADASSLFDHSLTFPRSGPVFILPDGYTVHSVSGLIEDNAWRGGGPPLTVPEPSSLLLVGAALLSFGRRVCARR